MQTSAAITKYFFLSKLCRVIRDTGLNLSIILRMRIYNHVLLITGILIHSHAQLSPLVKESWEVSALYR